MLHQRITSLPQVSLDVITRDHEFGGHRRSEARPTPEGGVAPQDALSEASHSSTPPCHPVGRIIEAE
jgi:hypothetical protein